MGVRANMHALGRNFDAAYDDDLQCMGRVVRTGRRYSVLAAASLAHGASCEIPVAAASAATAEPLDFDHGLLLFDPAHR